MKKNLITTTLLVGLASLASADWTIQHDFESGTPAELFYQATNRELSTDEAVIENGMLRVIHGDLLEETSNLYVLLPFSEDMLAASVAVGDQVSFYFEMMVPQVGDGPGIVDIAFGPSNIDPEDVATVRYDSFNAMMRMNSGTAGGFEVRDDTYYPVATLESGVKYSVWLDVDYNFNYFECYIQGGIFTERTRTNVGALSDGYYAFRKDPLPDGDPLADPPVAPQTVDYFALILSRGNSVDGDKGIDSMYFDNFATDSTGKNATKPAVAEPVMWAGYNVDGNGNADTMDWLGFVNVTNAPWVYSFSLNSYLYIDDLALGDNGAWIYVAK